MKRLFYLFPLIFGLSHATAEVLSQADKEALLASLEKLRAEANDRIDSRFGLAIAAYRAAMGSDDAALNLYIKCEEKVNFEDMNRSSGDFRDWRRRESKRLSDPTFKQALRHQLRWLALSLEAASEKPDRDKLAAEAQRIIDTMLANAEQLYPHRGILQQNVTQSVFARAYDVNSIKVDNWPLAPGQIGQIYEQILLPPHRRGDRIANLQDTWSKRLAHETIIVEKWSVNPANQARGLRPPQFDQFVTNTLPNLLWQSEMDLYQAGDERGAAVRMLKHIEKNITHPSAADWATQFTAILQNNAASAQ